MNLLLPALSINSLKLKRYIILPLSVKKINSKSDARWPLLAQIVKSAALAVRELGLPNLVGIIKQNKFINMFLFKKNKDEYFLSKDEVQYLANYFESDLINLEKMLGFDLSKWKVFKG